MRRFFSSLHARRIFYRLVLFAGDAVLVWASLRLAYATRFDWAAFHGIFPVTKGVPSSDLYGLLQWVAMGVWLATFAFSGFYGRVNLASLDEFLRVFRGVLTGWVTVLALTFLYRGVEYSRLVMGLSAGYVFLFVVLFRLLTRALYVNVACRWWEPHAVLVLGSGRMAKSIQKVLSQYPELSIISKPLRRPEELAEYLRAHPVREVYVGEPDLDHAALIDMTEECDQRDIPLRIVPDVLELRMGEVIYDASVGLPTFRIKPVTLHGWTYFYKRLFDVLASLVIVSVSIFPLLFLAFLIRLDSRGPVLLNQQRLGHRRKSFPFFKFRSMVANADDLLEDLKAKSDRPGPAFKMKNDPRITRVGKWIRKFSIDEIPQLLNVFRGEMSLVGPRPQVLWEAEAYDSWAKKRLNVLPGITGLWQVSGRAHLSYEQMIDLDVYYIEHWSPGLDLLILLRTIPTVLGSQGAY